MWLLPLTFAAAELTLPTFPAELTFAAVLFLFAAAGATGLLLSLFFAFPAAFFVAFGLPLLLLLPPLV